MTPDPEPPSLIQGYAAVSYLDELAGGHAISLSRGNSQPRPDTGKVGSKTDGSGNIGPQTDGGGNVGSRPDCDDSVAVVEWRARYWEWRTGCVQAVSCLIFVAASLVVGGGYIGGFAGRTMALLDPTYATSYMPIVASVSEHQPCTWSTYFLELHMIVPMLPVGLYFMFRGFGQAELFAILYLFTSAYFAGIMRRMLLVLAPAAAIVAGTGISAVLRFAHASRVLSMNPPIPQRFPQGDAVCVCARARVQVEDEGHTSLQHQGRFPARATHPRSGPRLGSRAGVATVAHGRAW